jgi:hypothetical protein
VTLPRYAGQAAALIFISFSLNSLASAETLLDNERVYIYINMHNIYICYIYICYIYMLYICYIYICYIYICYIYMLYIYMLYIYMLYIYIHIHIETSSNI